MKTVKKENRKQAKKDYSKYVLDGETYGKGKLVLAVIKRYVKLHPDITVKELKETFPKKEIGASFEIVEPIRKARKRRFFLKNRDINFTKRCVIKTYN